MKTLFTPFLFLLPFLCISQNVGIGTNAPDPSAQLEIQSTSGGVLIPRVTTTERNAIPSPANGLLVYNSATLQFEFFDGSIWKAIASSGGGSEISDIDGDTKISTETFSDEDTVRFYVKGFELLKMDDKTMHLNSAGNGTFLGQNAGKSSPSSNHWNTFIGHKSGENTSSGISNTFLGTLSGQNASGGNSNAFFGAGSGQNSTGSNNIYFGSSAGKQSNAGMNNSYIGTNAGFQNTGSNNIAIGHFAAPYGNSEKNIAIGNASLNNSAGKSGLVAIGDSALYNNGATASFPIHGIRNTAIGTNALKDNSKGANNTAIGYKTLQRNSTAANNTSIGSQNAHFITTGSSNTTIGSIAMYSNKTGSGNTMVGAESGRYNEGSQNTFIGTKTGLNNTTGSGNVYIGHAAGENETGNNKFILHNSNQSPPLIYGEFDSSRLTVNNHLSVTGKIKIGNTSSAPLEGEIRYDQSTKIFYGYDGTEWIPFHGDQIQQGTVNLESGKCIVPNTMLANDDALGHVMDVHNEYAVAGGVNHVGMYKLAGGVPILIGSFEGDAGGHATSLGRDVAIYDNYVVVGATRLLTNGYYGENTGGMNMYEIDTSTNTVTLDTFIAFPGLNNFGQHIDISDDQIIITNGTDVKIFTRNSGIWSEAFTISSTSVGEVKIEGKNAVYYNNIGAIILEDDGSSWNIMDTIQPQTKTTSNTVFSYTGIIGQSLYDNYRTSGTISLAVDEIFLLSLDSADNITKNGIIHTQGAVDYYKKENGQWVLKQKIQTDKVGFEGWMIQHKQNLLAVSSLTNSVGSEYCSPFITTVYKKNSAGIWEETQVFNGLLKTMSIDYLALEHKRLGDVNNLNGAILDDNRFYQIE